MSSGSSIMIKHNTMIALTHIGRPKIMPKHILNSPMVNQKGLFIIQSPFQCHTAAADVAVGGHSKPLIVGCQYHSQWLLGID